MSYYDVPIGSVSPLKDYFVLFVDETNTTVNSYYNSFEIPRDVYIYCRNNGIKVISFSLLNRWHSIHLDVIDGLSNYYNLVKKGQYRWLKCAIMLFPLYFVGKFSLLSISDFNNIINSSDYYKIWKRRIYD